MMTTLAVCSAGLGVLIAPNGVVFAGPPRRPSSETAATTQPDSAGVAPTSETSTNPAPAPAATTAPASLNTKSELLPAVPVPQGFSGDSDFPPAPRVGSSPGRAEIALPDRWRMGWPEWDRYHQQTDLDPIFHNQSGGDSPYTHGDLLNPYDRNLLKGDYPISGENLFLSVTAASDTQVNFRNLPTPSGASAAQSSQFDFFGDGKQLFLSETLALSLDLFKGYTSFRPVDWLIRVTPIANFNYLRVNEANAVKIDPRNGDERPDSFTTLGETFFELHLGDTSPNFDIAAVRIGRQLFVSDFRGFVYNDISDAVRLLGNAQSNRVQYNVFVANQNDKDTNSELPELSWRDQQVVIGNVYVQDFIWPGYTTQFSLHWNHDSSNQEFDNNGFPVVPDLLGSNRLHNIDAIYLGWAGDGHIGRLNINHAFYYVTGQDSDNPLAGREVDIGAFMGATELSVDCDWFRPKLSFLYASGDSNPTDSRAGGFDGILDNPNFAGGSSSFYQNNALRLLGVNLTSARSFYNDLAATKGEGQSNYVNPGTILLGAGFDAEITPKLRTFFNANSLWFSDTSSLEYFLNQNHVSNYLGQELNLAFQYRPWLNNNIIMTAGSSVFFPGSGFRDVYESSHPLFQLFAAITLTY